MGKNLNRPFSKDDIQMANKHKKRYLISLVIQFSSVQSLSRVQLFATPWTAACQAFLSITNSWSLFKLMSIQSVMPSNHFILCRPLVLLPSIFPSLVIREMQSKTTKIYFIPISLLYLKKKKKTKITSVVNIWKNWNHHTLLLGM